VVFLKQALTDLSLLRLVIGWYSGLVISCRWSQGQGKPCDLFHAFVRPRADWISSVAQSIGDNCLFAPKAKVNDCVSFVFDAWFCDVCDGEGFDKKTTGEQWDEIGYEHKLGAFSRNIGRQFARIQSAGPFRLLNRSSLVPGDLVAGINAGGLQN
jgi:hypothetical protein